MTVAAALNFQWFYLFLNLPSPPSLSAPAITIQSFVNGAIGTRLPSHSRWVEAYERIQPAL